MSHEGNRQKMRKCDGLQVVALQERADISPHQAQCKRTSPGGAHGVLAGLGTRQGQSNTCSVRLAVGSRKAHKQGTSYFHWL